MNGNIYKFTFEDGSEAFAHYGVKGMKWNKHLPGVELPNPLEWGAQAANTMGNAVNDYIVNPIANIFNPQQQQQQQPPQVEKKKEEVKEKAKETSAKLSDEQREKIATAVVRGDYGNGEERVKKLKKAGYDADDIQSRVNEMVWGMPKGSLSKQQEADTSERTGKKEKTSKSSESNKGRQSSSKGKSERKSRKRTKQQKALDRYQQMMNNNVL